MLQGKVKWLDDKQLAKIVDRAKALKYSVCGNIAQTYLLGDGTHGNHSQTLRRLYSMVIWESSVGIVKKKCPCSAADLRRMARQRA